MILGNVSDEGPRTNYQAFIYDHGVSLYVEGPTPGEFNAISGYDINDNEEIAGTTSPMDGHASGAYAWTRTCFAACCGR